MVDFPERHGFAYLTEPWAKLSHALVYRGSAQGIGPEAVGHRKLAVANRQQQRFADRAALSPSATIVPVQSAER